MSTATAEAPTETATSPFAAALEKAFTQPTETTQEQAPPKQEAKAPDVPQTRVGIPKELTKQSEPAKADAAKSPIDEIAEPSKMDAKGKAGWEALKSEARTWQTKATEIEKRIAEAKAAGRDTETLEAKLAEKEKQLSEYSELVARAKVETHPDFRREFIDGRAKLVSKAQAIIEESGGDKDAVATALNLKGKARVDALREVAEGLDNFQSGRLGRVIDELSDLDERAEAKREKSQQSYAELQEQERIREVESRSKLAKQRHLDFEDTTRRLKTDLVVLNRADGHDDWNAKAEAIIKGAQEAVDANPHTNIESEIKARAADRYIELFSEANALVEKHESRIAELEAELAAIHSRSPSLSPKTAPPAGSKNPFADALSAFVGQ